MFKRFQCGEPLLKFFGSRGHRDEAWRGNFEISSGKVDLVSYHWKGLFKTMILIKIILPCNDY